MTCFQRLLSPVKNYNIVVSHIFIILLKVAHTAEDICDIVSFGGRGHEEHTAKAFSPSMKVVLQTEL